MRRVRPAHQFGPAALALGLLTFVQGCSSSAPERATRPQSSIHEPKAAQAGAGSYKIGQPYRVGTTWYVPREQPGYRETGTASWYGSDFHGRATANGEIYNMHAMTAAHPTLPLPSIVRVENLKNGRSVVVRVNDRGPFVQGRIIDLSKQAADQLGFVHDGTAPVRVSLLGRAPVNGAGY